MKGWKKLFYVILLLLSLAGCAHNGSTPSSSGFYRIENCPYRDATTCYNWFYGK
jgi:hypothetical protein